MANLHGYTMAAAPNIINHVTRHAGDPHQERYRYRNQNIDTSRTHENYLIAQRKDPMDFIRRRVAEADKAPNKKANVLSDWIVTLPKNERLEGREREFFEETFRFLLKKTGGKDNLVGAWVHMDETSPHMHYCFVAFCEGERYVNDKEHPLRWTKRDERLNPEHRAGEVKRDSKGTVRYKRVLARDENGDPIKTHTISQTKMFGRKELREFHPDLSRHMMEHFGFDVGVEIEDKGDKILSKLEHGDYIAARTTLSTLASEIDVARSETERLKDKREELRREASEETQRLESLQGERRRAEERVVCLETVVAECSAADVAPISHKGVFLDRVASRCIGIARRLGLVIKRAGKAVEDLLAIKVMRGGSEEVEERIDPDANLIMVVTTTEPQLERAPSL